MRYEFHPEALEEYDAAALRYAERESALALRFIEAVEDASVGFSKPRPDGA